MFFKPFSLFLVQNLKMAVKPKPFERLTCPL